MKKRPPIAYFIAVPAVIILLSNLGCLFSIDISAVIGIAALPLCLLIFFSVCFISGRCLTTGNLIKAPEKPCAVYLPALLPFVTGLVINFFPKADSNTPFASFELYGNFMAIFALLNFFQTALSELGIGYLLVVNAAGLVSFAIGERRAAKSGSIDRPLPGIKFAAPAVIILAALFAGGEYSKYLHDLSTVDVDPSDYDRYIMMADRAGSREGYGFPYENGLSSVDLRPYYVENPENKLAVLSEPSELIISDPDKMPVLDGAEAAYPVYSAIANACYENIGEIQSAAKKSDDPLPMPVRFTNTIKAYESLISGDVDIFFGAMPSAAQKKLAEEAGKTLVMVPIGREAFVFFVSGENPVDGLTSEQIRDIYSGKTKSWSAVGGENIPILAFQRPKNSGSQTMMEHFMGDVPLKEPLKVEFEQSMVGVISAVADYQNKRSSIGYSFRYYASGMVDEGAKSGIKFLSLDGIYPDTGTIQSGEYPMTTSLYAIYLEDNDNENVPLLAGFMTGRQGQEIIEKTGYIPAG
ncbi:MAG: PstS family phosphate ABC transporter substrate-binding protein [Huintestinicola sp.]|uniref:PstS family phosphate ABC transporter substrate-binding protein n=1 Tax=Huintestinicola sp. TaxID=2981661 RepID=UPI003EFBBC8F